MTDAQITALDALIEAVERGEFRTVEALVRAMIGAGVPQFWRFRISSWFENDKMDAVKCLRAYRAKIGGDA